jgi:hypothetical protein
MNTATEAYAATRRILTLNSDNFLECLDELFERNWISDPAPHSMEGFAFKPHGSDEEYVRAITNKSPRRVATVVEGRDGGWIIRAGFHFVSRLFYIVTKEGVVLSAFADFRY